MFFFFLILTVADTLRVFLCPRECSQVCHFNAEREKEGVNGVRCGNCQGAPAH